MRDLDGDGKPELSSAAAGLLMGASGSANPTWDLPHISKQGDRVNGQHWRRRHQQRRPSGHRRAERLAEQPPKGSMDQLWTFHAAEFGNGGGEIGAHDVNGDGLTDVVTVWPHDFGLA
jgi:hypothetical protein